MIFTKLRLLGFKSFVDPTELIIAPGLTGVVGPNGCGKSNLLEALRWVMGESSAKAMRGGGMDDVIFAGAASRPARSFAEVSLSMDNSARTAPPGFNDQDSLDVVRRITREVGSAYKVNGKDARARDVRMLFADASTGAHSPSLVRQGQIAELINAKPKARRAILEEAAGISGLYQRRHEAELKLRGAETNLERVADVIEQLEGRLGQLARQAKQAARYREISEALRRTEAMLLYLRWREADAERARADAALTEGVQLTAKVQGEAARAAAARLAAEEATPPLREEETIAAAILQRLSVERDSLAEAEARARRTIESLGARIGQLGSDLERERALDGDAAGMIAKLDAEEAALQSARAGHDAALAGADGAAQTAVEALRASEEASDRAAEEAARLAARVSAAERRAAETSSLRAKAERAAEAARSAAEALAAEIARVEAGQDEIAARAEATRSAAAAAETALLAAEEARAAAQGAEADARARASEAGGEASGLRAEVQALERVLARGAGEVAPVLDSVQVEKGFEAALGAALGDDLKAPEASEGGSGWAELGPGAASDAPPPEGVAPLAARVKAPAALARRLARIGVVARADGARLQAGLAPGWRLVSVEGDLWRWDGFRLGAEEAPSAAAARLQQANRLADLRAALAAAEIASAEAGARHAEAKSALDAAAAADGEARRARRAADEAASTAARQLARAEADLDLGRGKLETLRGSLARREEERAAAVAADQDAREASAALDDPADARRAAEALRAETGAARTAMLAARAAAEDLRRAGAAREKRIAEAARERSGWRDRAGAAAKRIGEFEQRLAAAEAERAAAAAAPDEIAAKRATLAREIETAEARRRAAADALASGEAHLRAAEAAEREAERGASSAREARARLEALAESAVARAGEAAARIREEMDCGPEALLERIGADPDAFADVDAGEIEAARLRRQRDALGAVNLRAEEDAAEVSGEHATLAGEKADLEEAIAKLRQGVQSLNKEGRDRLLAAYAEVNEKFAVLFRHLFGGGEANLVLVESDDPLEAGLEIMCMPPGKKLATLSLLSGGEQTLTALSLIFAVFLSNPSPICVLDEVDAPLDDANVGRFCDLLDEMTRRTATRFLIISHHAVTMSRMDRLFGVTMAEKGVSQLVSVDLARAEALIDG